MSEETVIEVEFENENAEKLEQQASDIHLLLEEYCALIVNRKLASS